MAATAEPILGLALHRQRHLYPSSSQEGWPVDRFLFPPECASFDSRFRAVPNSLIGWGLGLWVLCGVCN